MGAGFGSLRHDLCNLNQVLILQIPAHHLKPTWSAFHKVCIIYTGCQFRSPMINVLQDPQGGIYNTSLTNGLSASLSALPKGIAQARASSRLASTVYGGPPKVS